ncbi:hypothetical protein DAI22_07g114500 [Oryza sativa Japonica Group]|nr:hypothetical protein DAI22_07g114500 [Oryza sativa Japonica Group]
MELAGVAERFHSRTVLITGATGFIAKLLVEKILRLQPGVKRLYLLVRAADQVSANRRVESEEGKKKEALCWFVQGRDRSGVSRK